MFGRFSGQAFGIFIRNVHVMTESVIWRNVSSFTPTPCESHKVAGSRDEELETLETAMTPVLVQNVLEMEKLNMSK